MKKQIFSLLALALVCTIRVSAQWQEDSIPNAGFEYWHNDSLPPTLNNWGSLNSLTYVQYHKSGLIRDTAHVGAGNYSVKIETIQAGTNIAVGGIFLSSLSSLAGAGRNFSGLGVPYSTSDKPDTIHFSYQCFESNKDTGTVLVIFKYQGSLVGESSYYITGVKNSWANVKMPIFYEPSLAIDTVFVLITSGGSHAIPGDYVVLDNIVITRNGSTTNVPQLPNNSFENWTTPTYIAANNWTSSDDIAAPLGGPTSLVQSTDAYSGKYAAQITTVSTTFGHDTLGFLFAGPLPTGGGEKGGFAYTHKPSVFSFYYKYSSFNGLDSGLAAVYFYNNGKTLDSFYIRLPQVSSYTKDSIAIPYSPTGIEPDTANIAFASSDITFRKQDVAVGSVLLIDGLAFSGGNTGIEQNRVLITANMFPNPAFSSVEVQCYSRAAAASSFTLYDALGRQALTKQINIMNGNNTFYIDVSALSPGVYTYRLQAGVDVLTSKLVIERSY